MAKHNQLPKTQGTGRQRYLAPGDFDDCLQYQAFVMQFLI